MPTRRQCLQQLYAIAAASLILSTVPLAARAEQGGWEARTGKYTHFWKDYRFRFWLEQSPLKAGQYQQVWLKVDRQAKGKWWYITLAKTYGKVFPGKAKAAVTMFGLLERQRGLYQGRFKVDQKGRYRLTMRLEYEGTVHEFDIPIIAK